MVKLTLYEAILYESTPNDLLSLYLTDYRIKKILDSNFLQLLNDKYKINSTNFISFYQSYNIKHLGHHHLLYLYNLENTLYKPATKISNNRYDCVLHLFNKKKEYKLTSYIFGLAVTLMDVYQIYKLDVAMVCMYIASYTLMEYIDIDLYNHYIKNNKKYKIVRFAQLHIDVVNKLQGYIIRPSTVFFTKHQDFAMLSYFNHELLNYKPSLIAETINYMSTGRYKIYLLAEMPCQLLKQTINNVKLKINIKYECQEYKFLKDIIVKEPKVWHIGNFKKIKAIGEGVGGNVYNIKYNKTNYVLKTIKNNIEPSVLEIMTLQNLKNPYIAHLYGFKILPKKTELFLTLGQKNLKEMQNYDIRLAMSQLLKGLDYCHHHDIIHRDIKPENIIYDGIFKLIDFGLAVPYSSFKKDLDPDLCGTINYRAPEALLGAQHYTTKVDIWSLCLVFYYMITKEEFSTLLSIQGNINLIFKQFGIPTNKTWPGVMKLPKWKKPGKLTVQYLELDNYQFILKGLILNPKKRANTSTLLNLL